MSGFAKIVAATPPPAVETRRVRNAQLVIMALLFIVVVGFDPLHTYTWQVPVVAGGGGDAVRQASFLVVAALCVLTSGVLQDARKLFVLPLSIAVVLGYFCLSLTWSVSPSIGARRLALTVMLIWIVFSSVQNCGYARTIAALRFVLLTTLVLNYIAIAVIPSAVHMGAELMDPNLAGNWRGVQTHKNFAGPTCALLIMVFLFDAQRFGTMVRIGIIAAATFFLYKTSSKTSVILTGAAIAVGFMYGRIGLRWRPVALAGIGFCVVLALVLLPLFWDEVARLFEREDAFTGRVQIWHALLAYAGDNWLGAGYGSFWNVGPDSPIYRYTKSWVSQIFTGHNGYLDLLVQVGPFGLALVVTMTFIGPIVRLFMSRDVTRGQGSLLLSILVFCAGHNLTESSIYDRDIMLQIILMTAVALVHVISKPDRPQVARPLLDARRPRGAR